MCRGQHPSRLQIQAPASDGDQLTTSQRPHCADDNQGEAGQPVITRQPHEGRVLSGSAKAARKERGIVRLPYSAYARLELDSEETHQQIRKGVYPPGLQLEVFDALQPHLVRFEPDSLC